jgi:hypothetical protein
VLSGETQQAEDAVQKLKQAFWCANSCFNDIVWAYQQEENQARREFLKKAYEDITGNDIESTLRSLTFDGADRAPRVHSGGATRFQWVLLQKLWPAAQFNR